MKANRTVPFYRRQLRHDMRLGDVQAHPKRVRAAQHPAGAIRAAGVVIH